MDRPCRQLQRCIDFTCGGPRLLFSDRRRSVSSPIRLWSTGTRGMLKILYSCLFINKALFVFPCAQRVCERTSLALNLKYLTYNVLSIAGYNLRFAYY